jgi:hypothetical protein
VAAHSAEKGTHDIYRDQQVCMTRRWRKGDRTLGPAANGPFQASILIDQLKEVYIVLDTANTPASFMLLQLVIDYGIATGYLCGQTVQRASG